MGRLTFKPAHHVFATREEQQDGRTYRKERTLEGIKNGGLRRASDASVREQGGWENAT